MHGADGSMPSVWPAAWVRIFCSSKKHGMSMENPRWRSKSLTLSEDQFTRWSSHVGVGLSPITAHHQNGLGLVRVSMGTTRSTLTPSDLSTKSWQLRNAFTPRLLGPSAWLLSPNSPCDQPESLTLDPFGATEHAGTCSSPRLNSTVPRSRFSASTWATSPMVLPGTLPRWPNSLVHKEGRPPPPPSAGAI